MTTFISTCATKAEFKQRVRAGLNITMYDPTLDGRRGHTVTLREVQDNAGHHFTVTNKARRWFAEVTVKPERKLVVK